MAPTHYQTDKLQELINWDVLLDLPRHAGGHDEHMKNLFKGAEVIAHWNEGDWQGMVATCAQLEDGRYVIYNDFYGSCSGCDAWSGASDAEIRYLCVSLSNSTKVFHDYRDLTKFLEDPDGDVEWTSWSEPARHLLEELPDQIKIKHKV